MAYKILAVGEKHLVIMSNQKTYTSQQLAIASLFLMKDTIKSNDQDVIDLLCRDLAQKIPDQIRIVYFEACVALLDQRPECGDKVSIEELDLKVETIERVVSAVDNCLIQLRDKVNAPPYP